MTSYEQRMAELGIDRGALAGGFGPDFCGALGRAEAEPELLNPKASMKVKLSDLSPSAGAGASDEIDCSRKPRRFLGPYRITQTARCCGKSFSRWRYIDGEFPAGHEACCHCQAPLQWITHKRKTVIGRPPGPGRATLPRSPDQIGSPDPVSARQEPRPTNERSNA